MPTVFLLLWASLSPDMAPSVVAGFPDIYECHKAATVAKRMAKVQLESREAQALGLTFVCAQIIGDA